MPHRIRYAGKQSLLYVRFRCNQLRRLLHRLGQCALIHLLILGHGNGFDLHGHRRNHVRRLLLQYEAIQGINGNGFIRHNISSDVFAAGNIVKSRNGGVLDARETADDLLHLGQLDAETTDLDLAVPSADKLKPAILHITHNITGVINPIIARLIAERIRSKGLSRLFRTVQIGTGYLTTGNPEFPRRTRRQQLTLLVYHIEL